MRWSILVLTIPSRPKMLQRLKDCLEPQLRDGVELCITKSDLVKSVGDNRNRMIEEAQGEYVSFIDDDDLVSPKYVETILPLLDGVDHVGFPVQVFRDGVFLLRAYHSLKYGDWCGSNYRDISHLNPIRREHALKVKMNGSFSEDARWAADLRALNIVKTEHYIPETMYFYHYQTIKKDS